MSAPTPGEQPIDLLGCESCGLVAVDQHLDGTAEPVQRCARCGHALRGQKPFAVQRTWACVASAAVLYVPANVFPIMVTTNALQREEHTLLGGIRELWIEGSWMLAIIVFIASIAVPVLKICVLALLAWSVQKAPRWRRLERARLYRLVEVVGQWSMLDVFVVVLLGATVRFGPLASVEPGPALLSFASVVVLTLFATWSFDPRLIWRGGDVVPARAEAVA